MKKLTDLFKLIEITRDQPQYGYNLAGLNKHELSDLAQHHYLVTFITWQLGLLIQKAGGKVNIFRAMEISMMHDLGELFGGDICHYYAKANPTARTLAKQYEHENNNFLSQYFHDQTHYMGLVKEMEEVRTDESILAKTADYMEVLHYKQRIQKLDAQDLGPFMAGIQKRASELKDEQSRITLSEFLDSWSQELPQKTTIDIISATEYV
jgi:5'-deoxynucleotidase YfbR-like HD superfamily hydrolase